MDGCVCMRGMRRRGREIHRDKREEKRDGQRYKEWVGRSSENDRHVHRERERENGKEGEGSWDERGGLGLVLDLGDAEEDRWGWRSLRDADTDEGGDGGRADLRDARRDCCTEPDARARAQGVE